MTKQGDFFKSASLIPNILQLNVLVISRYVTYVYCSSQPSMVHRLSSSIFPCLSFVRLSPRYGNIRPNLHFFQYIQAYKPFADPVPPNTKQYQHILTKYQPVSSYTDPVPSSTTYYSSSRRAQFSQLNNFSF